MKISRKPTNPVPLVTKGDLSLYFVGCGSAFARTLYQNNLLITKGHHHLLIDCGTRCSQALHEAGLHFSQIQNYLITHSHADHIGGLEEVQLFARYVLQQKPNMVINKSYEKILWEQSLHGGSEISENGRLTFETNVGNSNIKMPRTLHFPDNATSWRKCAWSCGVIIDDRIFFTSDTQFDPEFVEGYDKRLILRLFFTTASCLPAEFTHRLTNSALCQNG